MVKAYFDYIQSHVFGLANRNNCTPVFIQAMNLLVLGCAELALIVNLKTGEVIRKLDCKKKTYISCIELFENSFNRHLAIGFEDGDIAIFDMAESSQKLDDEEFFLFSEHDSAVTSIAFSPNGAFMASGSMENIVILWDVIGRSVKHKFTGHSAPITGVEFYKNFKDSSDYIISSAKDGCLRVWDIDTRRCIDIITSKKNEVLGICQLTSQHLKFVRNELFVATTNSEEVVFYEMKVTQSAEKATKYHEEIGRFARNHYSAVLGMQIADSLGLIFLLSRFWKCLP
jgi:WD40 repeat protein